jgi:hypothetical protein
MILWPSEREGDPLDFARRGARHTIGTHRLEPPAPVVARPPRRALGWTFVPPDGLLFYVGLDGKASFENVLGPAGFG